MISLSLLLRATAVYIVKTHRARRRIKSWRRGQRSCLIIFCPNKSSKSSFIYDDDDDDKPLNFPFKLNCYATHHMYTRDTINSSELKQVPETRREFLTQATN